MNELKAIFSGVQILTLIGFAVTLLKLIINYINASEFDRLLRTPWKEFVDKYVVSSVFSVLFLLTLFSELIEKSSWKKEIIEYPISYLILFSILYILVTIIMFAFGSLITNLQKLLWNKREYYVIDENKIKWTIEKSIDKNRLYIRNKKITKVLSSFDEIEIYKEVIPNGKVSKIFDKFDSFKHFKIISIIMFCLIPVFFFVFLFLFEGFLRLILIILLMVYGILFVIFLQGYNDYRDNKNQDNQDN